MKNTISGTYILKKDLKLLNNSIGLRLKQARLKSFLTQKQLATKAKIKISKLSKIEHRISMLSLDEAKRISKILKVTPQFLIANMK